MKAFDFIREERQKLLSCSDIICLCYDVCYDVAINNSSGQITNQVKLSKVVSLKFSSTLDFQLGLQKIDSKQSVASSKRSLSSQMQALFL
jgi:hypothetical protein